MMTFAAENNQLNLSLFHKYKELIYNLSGINLSDKKITLLSNRIRKRLKALNFPNYKAYYDYLISHPEDENEMTAFINAVSTNVTHFFRNPKELEAFRNNILPQFIKQNRNLKILSAGCSTGEEAYTIALILKSSYPHQLFHIDAVDISTTAIEKAKQGIYEKEKVLEHVSAAMVTNFFKPVSDTQLSVSDKLKYNIHFDKMDIVHQSFKKVYDIIFCRNVVIYFDKPTKTKVYENIHNALSKTGYFLVGHSEGLVDNTKFHYLQPGIYEKV